MDVWPTYEIVFETFHSNSQMSSSWCHWRRSQCHKSPGKFFLPVHYVSVNIFHGGNEKFDLLLAPEENSVLWEPLTHRKVIYIFGIS